MAEDAVFPETSVCYVGAEVQDQGLVLSYTCDVTGLVVEGQVLMGSEDGGYIRRVTAVEVLNSGRTLVVATVPATLADVIENGTLEVLIPAEEASQARREIDLSFDFAPSAGITLGSEGSFVFDPAYRVKFEFADGEARAVDVSVVGNLELRSDLVVAASVAGTWSSDPRVVTEVSRPFLVPAGPLPIPIPGEITLKVTAGAAVSASASFDARFGRTTSSVVEVGGSYDFAARTFQPSSSMVTTEAKREPTWTLTGHAEATLWVKPELDVTIARLAGPRADIELSLVANVDYGQDPESVDYGWKVDAKAKGTVGVYTAGLLGENTLWEDTYLDRSARLLSGFPRITDVQPFGVAEGARTTLVVKGRRFDGVEAPDVGVIGNAEWVSTVLIDDSTLEVTVDAGTGAMECETVDLTVREWWADPTTECGTASQDCRPGAFALGIECGACDVTPPDPNRLGVLSQVPLGDVCHLMFRHLDLASGDLVEFGPLSESEVCGDSYAQDPVSDRLYWVDNIQSGGDTGVPYQVQSFLRGVNLESGASIGSVQLADDSWYTLASGGVRKDGRLFARRSQGMSGWLIAIDPQTGAETVLSEGRTYAWGTYDRHSERYYSAGGTEISGISGISGETEVTAPRPIGMFDAGLATDCGGGLYGMVRNDVLTVVVRIDPNTGATAEVGALPVETEPGSSAMQPVVVGRVFYVGLGGVVAGIDLDSGVAVGPWPVNARGLIPLRSPP